MKDSLRHRAEEIAKAAKSLRNPPLSSEEMQEKLHDLLVHEIELEMQNEELRQAQTELETVRARYFDLYDLAPVGYVTLSEQGLILEANSTIAAMLGASRGTLVDQPISRFIFKEDQDLYYLHRKHIVASGERQACGQQQCELRLVNEDGAPFWVQVESKNVRESDGEIVHLTMISDISARKKTEDELSKVQSYLADILDSMPSVLIGVDPQGVVTHWNKAAEEATGISAVSALGRPLEEAFPRLRPQMRKVRTVLQDRKPQVIKREVFMKDHEKGFQDVMVYPVAGNGVEGAVVRVDDVTKWVQIEEVMVQSEKMMSVGGLAAGMAHEINNPLSGILQSTQVLFSRLLPDVPANVAAAAESGCSMEGIRSYAEKRKIFTFLDAIRQSGTRAASIVSNMLGFCRTGDTQHVATDINALLDKAVDLSHLDYDLKTQFDFKRIRIIRQYDQYLPKVHCASSEIEQVILNLLRNAAQAIMLREDVDSGPAVTLRTGRDGGLLRIEVEDNGCGMTEAVRKRVFEPFFTTKGVGEGTGLGLAVSYFIIVTKHGGSFDVQSQPGRGSCFIIRIPMQSGQDASGRVASADASGDGGIMAAGHSR